jgi:hypothetical protein
MNKTAATEFDFDEWARIAREDPAEFERRRLAAIEALIAAAPGRRQRLEGTQWRLDRERELAHTPLKACLRMSAMMWDSFLAMKSGLDEIAKSASQLSSAPHFELVSAPAAGATDDDHAGCGASAKSSAQVLPFVRRQASEDAQ